VALRRRDARPLAVLSIDLDQFKLVNDRLGHAAGDALLVQTVERLRSRVSTGDTVARLGGDEFAILVEAAAAGASSVAQRVVELFDEPFDIDGQLLFIRSSVGLAVAGDDARDASADALVKQSDAAMYVAKRNRTGYAHALTAGTSPFGPDEPGVPAWSAHDSTQGGGVASRLLYQLRHAIDHGDLQVVYQPKVALRTGEVVGVEALVRWPHPDRGVLLPDQFLPLVRSNNLMEALTDVVLARALGDAAAWYSGGHALPVAVNLFPASLADNALPDRIRRALATGGLRADCLTLEITEDLVLRDAYQTRSVLRRLRESGVRASPDDFGSGYSDLRYLRELPVDEVKLDRHLILVLLGDPRVTAIVRAVIDLVHTLGMTCVAEGVENEATAQRLSELGRDIVQGYHYSTPVTNTALLEMLRTRPTADASRLTFPLPAG
jgi:diguanylate cyclase (GGDEF)-like protein